MFFSTNAKNCKCYIKSHSMPVERLWWGEELGIWCNILFVGGEPRVQGVSDGPDPEQLKAGTLDKEPWLSSSQYATIHHIFLAL